MSEELFGGRVPSGSPDFRSELAARLADLVPEAVADGKVDVVKLRELLGSDASDEKLERFGLFWPGKRRALQAAQEQTTATLLPDLENSRDWDTTGNVFIEGDNLEVLKILQRHYHGKIKMIYIDPPYNTGKDFVYPDNYKEGLASYLEWTKQVNEEGKKISTNSDTDGRYHSNWLSMMYPRLKLAKNLLTEDGVIFISIDDNEYENLKKICNEIFGEPNVSTMIWNKEAEGSSGALKVVKTFRRVHEYIIVCTKNESLSEWNKVREPLAGRESEFQTANLAVNAEKERKDHPNFYTLTSPSGDVFLRQWKWSKEEVEMLINEDLIYWGSDGHKQPRLIIPTDERRTTYLLSILNYGGTTTGRKDFESDLGEDHAFSYPKPILLLKKLMLATTTRGDIILDFFAGSGTTACAVIDINLDTGESRSFIQVQLPEPLEIKIAGFRTIAELSRARIISHINKSKASGLKDAEKQKLGLGFRAFRLAESNFPVWRVSSGVAVSELEKHIDEIAYFSADQANAFDCLMEVLIKLGFSLSVPIKELESDVFEAYSVGEGDFIAVVGSKKKAELDDFATLLDLKPSRFLVMEDAYQGSDELKTNLEQECSNRQIELIKK